MGTGLGYAAFTDRKAAGDQVMWSRLWQERGGPCPSRPPVCVSERVGGITDWNRSGRKIRPLGTSV